MQVHHYTENAPHIYMGSSEARQSPMEPGVWLLPAHATFVEPSADLENMVQVFNGASWEYQDMPVQGDAA